MTLAGFTTQGQSVQSFAGASAAVAMHVSFHMGFLSVGCTLLGIELKLARMVRIAREKFASLLTPLANLGFCLLMTIIATKIAPI